MLSLPAQWNTLWGYGASGLGKTKFFCATAGENICFIKPFDSIGCVEALMRKFKPGMHDCIVLDEVDLKFMSRAQAIAFVDPDEEFEMDVRFKSFTMPRGVKKVLISNPPPEELIPIDPHGAIMRRITIMHISQPTYALPAAGPATQVQPTPAVQCPATTLATPITQQNVLPVPAAIAAWQALPSATRLI